MGVHDTDVYPEVKELLGIPDEEPIFILRGKDKIASDALHLYFMFARYAGASNEFLGSTPPEEVMPGTVDAAIRAFERFEDTYPDRMKVPD